MKKLFFLIFLCTSFFAKGQNINGYWYGKASVTAGIEASNYLVELIIKENKTAVEGVMNYYFKNTYRSLKVTGNYNSRTRELNLFNIPVTYYGSTANLEVDCIMDFRGTFRVSQVDSRLTGYFIGKENYRNTCPDLAFDIKLNTEAGNEDSILTALKNFKETYQLWTPSATDTLVADNIISRPVVNYVIAKEFKEREIEIVQEIEVDSDTLMVDFFDNGEVDGDSISIFYNNQLVAFNRKLSTKAVHFEFGLDTARAVNELSMFADNLGGIPPNTALMLLYDGKKRYEVRLSSNLEKSATIRIRKRQKP